ncbi:MAG TPA: hypothetical protein VMT52_06950 [Planctomycetota bacterium]|nr:hypothetical protein [Planctomycetota bacterium]
MQPRRLLVVLALASLVSATTQSVLKAQVNCPCTTTSPFGSCTEKRVVYPDFFPGSVVVTPPGGGSPAFLYVADLYSGFTYRYEADRFDTASPLKFPSPRGSNATTGLTYRQTGALITLFWAIEDRIFSTGLDGGNVQNLGAVQLEPLAQHLRTVTGDSGIERGSLGGITNHGSRNTLWGVDIVNDVYFELRDNGELVLEDGNPVFFFNPKRNTLAGGAYGNSITYAASGGKEYFDIPVGSLVDRRPSEVHRVHAVPGLSPDSPRTGDGTGIIYSLGQPLAAPKFVSGIAFWPDSCGAGQSSEIILDMDVFGGTARIVQVAADEPAAATIADFTCSKPEPRAVALTWQKTLPYTSLKITRQQIDLVGSVPATIFETTDFANDPEKFDDAGLLDGTYEYQATVTATAPLAPVTCVVTVGLGSLLAHRRFTGGGSSTALPYAITIVKAERVMVADLNTSDTEIFDLNLMPQGTLDGPIIGGLTTGLAYNSDNDLLYWLENRDGSHFLHVTDLNAQSVGGAVRVDTPTNLDTGVQLGDLTHDATRNYFLTMDLISASIYAITPAGAVPLQFKTKQFLPPERTGFQSGGVAVAASSEAVVTLDIPVGKLAGGIVDQIARVEYNPALPETAGRELRRLDLRSTTGASDFGGIAALEVGNTRFEYLVGMDTRRIYKLSLAPLPTGGITFRRGDVNNDTTLNISDPSALLANLFKGGSAPTCPAAADSDDSGTLDIADAIYLFLYLFGGGPAPPPPFLTCGFDAGSPLECPDATCVDA